MAGNSALLVLFSTWILNSALLCDNSEYNLRDFTNTTGARYISFRAGNFSESVTLSSSFFMTDLTRHCLSVMFSGALWNASIIQCFAMRLVFWNVNTRVHFEQAIFSISCLVQLQLLCQKPNHSFIFRKNCATLEPILLHNSKNLSCNTDSKWSQCKLCCNCYQLYGTLLILY